MIYFSFLDANDRFDEKKHPRNDLNIIKLVIQDEEGCFPCAKVFVAPSLKKNLHNWSQKNAVISYESNGKITHLFRGKISGLPLDITDKMMILEFVAVPNDAQEKAEKIISLNSDKIPNVIFKNNDLPMSQKLDSSSEIIIWDRNLLKGSLTDLFQGKKKISLGDRFYRDTLKASIVNIPYRAVKVHLKASWQDYKFGKFDLFPKISKMFPDEIVSTYTADDFLRRWPRESNKSDSSGYRILRSYLKEYQKNDSFLKLKKETSKKTKGNSYQEKFLKKSYFKGMLEIGWSVPCYFVEKATIFLENKTIIPSSSQKIKEVFIDLKNLDGVDLKGTFFKSENSIPYIEYATSVAKAHLAGSSRGYEVRFITSIDSVLSISLDHSVCLNDNRFVGGTVTGKVKRYKMVFDGKSQQYFCEVFLGVSLGTGDTKNLDYLSESYQIKEIIDEENIEKSKDYCEDFVESIEFQNLPNEQMVIFEKKLENSSIQEKAMRENATKFKFKLRSLNFLKKQKKHYFISFPYSWSAPKQI